ncbi:MAG: flagellar protein FlaG [Nitrospiria bacterium]
MMEIKTISLISPPAQKPFENPSQKEVKPIQKGTASIERNASVPIEGSNDPSPEMPKNIVAYKALFSMDDLGNVVIKVLDQEGELVKQIPPEQFLKAAEALKESFGNILDLEA